MILGEHVINNMFQSFSNEVTNNQKLKYKKIIYVFIMTTSVKKQLIRLYYK